MQTVILAGGLGTRLGSLTKNIPKSLVLVNGKPFLEYQLKLLKENGIEDVVICIGHLGEQIKQMFSNGKRFNMNIKYSVEDKLLGTAGAIKKAEPMLDDIFFTMYGDSYVFLDFREAMRSFEKEDKLALMTVYKNHNLYDKSNTAIADKMVTKYSKKDVTPDMVYIDYGVNIFRKNAFALVRKNEYCPLETVFPHLIQAGQLLAYESRERFYEIGSVQGLEEFSRYVG